MFELENAWCTHCSCLQRLFENMLQFCSLLGYISSEETAYSSFNWVNRNVWTFKQLLTNLKAAIGSLKVNGHVMQLCITLQRACDLLVIICFENKWCNWIKSYKQASSTTLRMLTLRSNLRNNLQMAGATQPSALMQFTVWCSCLSIFLQLPHPLPKLTISQPCGENPWWSLVNCTGVSN